MKQASSLIVPFDCSKATLGSSLQDMNVLFSQPTKTSSGMAPSQAVRPQSPAGRTAPASSSFAQLPPLTPVQRFQCWKVSVRRDQCSFPVGGVAAQGRCDCNKSPGFVLACGCVENSFPKDPHACKYKLCMCTKPLNQAARPESAGKI